MSDKTFFSTILYFSGLVGAMTIALGITQAIFTDRLVNNVTLSGSLCKLEDNSLTQWKKTISSNTGALVYLKVEIVDDLANCKTRVSGEYPFLKKVENSSIRFTMPLIRSTTANYMPRLQIPVSKAAAALLVDGFLDPYAEDTLQGSGIFFVDLQNNPHSGPLYRFVPAPFTLEILQIYKCSATFYNTSSFLARSWIFTKNCISPF